MINLTSFFGLSVYLIYTVLFLLFFRSFAVKFEFYLDNIKIKKWIIDTSLFLIIFSFFVILLFFNSSMSDIPTHMRIAKSISELNLPPGHFLYFFLVSLLSFFSTNEFLLIGSSLLILSLSVLFKYNISLYFFTKYEFDKSTVRLKNILNVFLILSLFAMPIITYPIFGRNLGVFSFNVWHNSTTIFVIPFALILFYQSYLFLKGVRFKYDVLLMLLMVFLNIASKPSFFLIFIAVFPIFSLYKFKLKRNFFISILPLFWGAMLLIGQYFYIYQFNSAGSSKSDVAFYPFIMLTNPVDLIKNVVNLFFSFFFPFLFLVLNFRVVKKDLSYMYSFCLFLVSLFIYFSFNETGIRANHGNFSWQIIIAGYIWFVVNLFHFIKQIKEKGLRSSKCKILLWAIGLHLISFFIWLFLYIGFKLW